MSETYEQIIEQIPKTMLYDDASDRIALLNQILSELGSPQSTSQNIHICGTNGKGSTGTIINRMLRTHHQKVGHFSSPAMYDDLDQITIDGTAITEEEFVLAYIQLKKALSSLSLTQADISIFETYFIVCVIHFSMNNVDWAIYECGLGGGLDATNALGQSEYTIFTKIAMDHMAVLGSTLDAIATTKAEIIDDDSTVINYPNQNPLVSKIIKRAAQKHHSELYNDSPFQVSLVSANLTENIIDFRLSNAKYTERLSVQLAGKFQIDNLQNTLNWAYIYNQDHPSCSLTDYELINALKTVALPGRMELLQRNPTIIIDGAHNVDSISALADTLGRNQHYHMIVGFLKDKDYTDCMPFLKSLDADFVLTEPYNSERFLSKETLAQTFKQAGITDVTICKDLPTALHQLKDATDPIIITGSFYLINHVRTAIEEGALE